MPYEQTGRYTLCVEIPSSFVALASRLLLTRGFISRSADPLVEIDHVTPSKNSGAVKTRVHRLGVWSKLRSVTEKKKSVAANRGRAVKLG